MTFGQKLKALRKEHSYSQEEFAQLLDVSRQAVSKWESDRGTPETDKLLQISTIFGVTLDYLLKNEHPEDSQHNSGYYVSREMIDGFLLYRRQGAKRLAIGVSLIIVANIFYSFGFDRQLGNTMYWITTAIGFSILIWHFFQLKRYQEISTKQLLFDDLVIKDFREKHDKNRKRYIFMIIVGAVIISLGSPISHYFREYMNNDIGKAISSFLNAIWPALFILAGTSLHAENLIARNNEYISKKSSRGKFSWLYICLPVTAIAVIIGLITNVWSPFAPIIVLFCILLVTVCKLILEGRNSK